MKDALVRQIIDYNAKNIIAIHVHILSSSCLFHSCIKTLLFQWIFGILYMPITTAVTFDILLIKMSPAYQDI